MSSPPKYFVVGDIHGRSDRLANIIQQVNLDESDKFIFLGDYVDRGKHSREVIEQVKRLVEDNKAIALLGNHDEMFVRCHLNPHDEMTWQWKKSYAKKSFQSYYTSSGFQTILLDNHISWLNSLPHRYKTKDFHFSHSGVKSDLLWGRPQGDYPIDNRYNIHGHTPVDEVYLGMNRANLDTGCAWEEGYLTCVVWEEGNLTPLEILRSN